MRRLRNGLANPWHRPRLLVVVAWTYFAWWFVPVILAIRFSFDAGSADITTSTRGFTLQTYVFAFRDVELRAEFLESLKIALVTMIIATPLGAAMALGLHRWRSRVAVVARGVTFLALATPQVVFAIALFLLFAFTYHLRLDATTVLLGHATLAIPFVTVIVLTRLIAIGTEYEEMAMDLGASPTESLRRVTAPLVAPALIVAAVVAFTVSFDNFVFSDWLCLFDDCRTLPLRLYGSTLRGAPPDPVVYAAATMALALSLLVFVLASSVVRATRLSFGSRGPLR